MMNRTFTRTFLTAGIMMLLGGLLTGVSLAQATTPAVAPVTYSARISARLDIAFDAGNSAVFMAPDGTKFAQMTRDQACLFAMDGTPLACSALDALSSLDTRSVRWSDDSRYLVLTENFFQFLNDSDIWVIDTQANTLTNLTDDGVDRMELNGEWENTVDINPVWLPNGNILFIRYSNLLGTIVGSLQEISPTGGETTPRPGLVPTTAFAAYALAAARDTGRVAYTYYTNTADTNNGVWVADTDEGQVMQILIPEKPADAPVEMALSPAGDFVLAGLPLYGMNQPGNIVLIPVSEPAATAAQPLETELPLRGATWSPDGAGLAYVVSDSDPTTVGLYVQSPLATPAVRVLAGDFAPTVANSFFFTWSANNVILLYDRDTSELVVIQLEGAAG